VLMVIAIASAVFGWIGLGRARDAEAEAQKSRKDAEKLVSFLIEDFYTELEPTGRLETLGKLAHMTVAYYDGLPPELVTPRTQIFRAMAMVREAAAENASGKVDDAFKHFAEAEAVFEKLRAAGDHSEAVTYGLALTLSSEGNSFVGGGNNGRGTSEQLVQAADLLRPMVYAPNGSRRARQLYGDTLNYLSHEQPLEKGVATCDEARNVLAGLGALDLSDLDATASYADTADSEARELLALGRIADAKALETQVYVLAEKVLGQRPSDLHSLSDRSYAAELLGSLANRLHDDASAADYSNRAVQAGDDEVRFNPADLGSWARWAISIREVADLQLERGEVAHAIATLRALLALEQDRRRPASLGPVVWFQWIPLVHLQAETGDSAGAAQSLKAFARDTGEYLAMLAPDNPRRRILATAEQGIASHLQLIEGQSQPALTNSMAAVESLEQIRIPPGNDISVTARTTLLGRYLDTATRAALRLGHYPQAEALARRWLALPADPNSERDPQIDPSSARAELAHALAMQGRLDEAQKTLQPALAYYQHDQEAGAHGTDFRLDYAYALYVSALTYTSGNDQPKREAALDAAAALIAGASAEARDMASMREVSNLIATARASKHG